jgi:hypothetical protein
LSFLSTAFLFALPLALAPIAIHLYRSRQREVIRWGAMQFLSSAATKGRTLERLEELFLLLLRLAAVLALIFALAQPMVKSSWFGAVADGETILVIDDSLSTSRSIDSKPVVERLKEQGVQLIDSLTSAQSVQVLLASGAEWMTAEGIVADAAGKRRLRKILEEVQSTEGQAQLLGCVQAAVQLEAPDGLAARRIVVLNDNQAASWQLQSDAAWRQLGEAINAAPIPTTVEVVDHGLAERPLSNLAVTKLDASRKLIRPGEGFDLSAEITNTGGSRSGGAGIEWLLGNKIIRETPLESLEPGGISQVTESMQIDDPGTHLVSCRIQTVDDVPLDQADSVVIESAHHTTVLVVEQADISGVALSAFELLAAALGHTGEPSREWQSVFRPEIVEPDELSHRSLDEVRAIVISNLGELDRGTVDRLESFVRSGGGLWVGLGEGVERDRFNRDWYSDGGGLSPLALDLVETLEKQDEPAASLRPPSRTHPATTQLANTTVLDIDEARLRQRWKFAQRPASEDVVSTLLQAGDGAPFVAEHFVGEGRVLVQAAPLGLEWTNLPLLKAYVVMVRDWLAYLTAPTSSRFNLSSGAPIVAAANDKAAELITPRGRKSSLVALEGASTPTIRYSQTALPGIYRLQMTTDNGSMKELPFHVARNGEESHLKSLTDDERARLETAGIQFSGANAAAAGTTRISPPRREPLWGVLLAALVTILAAELLVASRLSKQRFGIDVAGI